MASKVIPLSNVDAAWLKMEHPTNLMMVSGVLTFARPLDFDHLRALIETRLLSFERFRQRVVKPSLPLAPPYWEADPRFDLKAHLHRISLPHPHDKLALQHLVSDLMSTPLDFSKPLWQMHVVEGYGDKGALIVRLHHCIADGMALVGVLLALTEMTPGAAAPSSGGELVPFEENGALLRSDTLGALAQRASAWFGTGVDVGRRTLIEGLESYLNHDRPRQLVEQGADYTYTASKLVLMSADPKTALKGTLGVAKRAAWSRPLPLGEVKAIRKATGATINDLMITAVAGALGRYLEGRGEPTEGVTIRAVVPVNLRKPEEMGEMGNRFGLVFAELPVGIHDLKQRLATVQKNMDAHKNSLDAPVSLDILAGMGVSPQVIENLVLKIFAAKATAVMTNVPGPPIPLYMAGQPIESLMFWVPQSGRLGIGISILSYAGQIMLGIATDAGLIPDPDSIVNNFYMEYDELLKLV
jgi:WS/DGAT/MGAT family acyltransferase